VHHLETFGEPQLGGDALQGLGEAGLLCDDGQLAGGLGGADAVGGLDVVVAAVVHGHVLDDEGVHLPDAVPLDFG